MVGTTSLKVSVRGQLGVPWELPYSFLWYVWERKHVWMVTRVTEMAAVVPLWQLWQSSGAQASSDYKQAFKGPHSLGLSVPILFLSQHSDEVWRPLPGFPLTAALLFHDPILHLVPLSAPFIAPVNCSLVFQSWLLSTSKIASRESLSLVYFLSKCFGRILMFITLFLGRTEKEGGESAAFSCPFKS